MAAAARLGLGPKKILKDRLVLPQGCPDAAASAWLLWCSRGEQAIGREDRSHVSSRAYSASAIQCSGH